MVARIYGFYLQVVKTIFLQEMKGNYTPPCNFLFTRATYGRLGLGCISVFLLFFFYGCYKFAKLRNISRQALRSCELFRVLDFASSSFGFVLFVAVDI